MTGDLSEFGIKAGDHVLVHVPPGWMMAGTVVKVLGERLQIKDAIYVEDIGSGHSVVEICATAKAQQQKAICTQKWTIPDGTVVLPMAIFPMQRDVRPLAKANEAAAVESV